MLPARRTKSPSISWRQRLIAGLCVFLILLVGAAQLLHVHAADEDHGSCTWCAVAHLSAAPAAHTAVPTLLQRFGRFTPPREPQRQGLRSIHRHTIRPPPPGLNVAAS